MRTFFCLSKFLKNLAPLIHLQYATEATVVYYPVYKIFYNAICIRFLNIWVLISIFSLKNTKVKHNVKNIWEFLYDNLLHISWWLTCISLCFYIHCIIRLDKMTNTFSYFEFSCENYNKKMVYTSYKGCRYMYIKTRLYILINKQNKETLYTCLSSARFLII